MMTVPIFPSARLGRSALWAVRCDEPSARWPRLRILRCDMPRRATSPKPKSRASKSVVAAPAPAPRAAKVDAVSARVAKAEKARKEEEQHWENVDGMHGTPFYCSGRPRPLFRGRMHLYSAFASPLFTYYILSLCRSAEETAAALLACTGACACFGASGAYHRFDWKTEANEAVAALLDYSGIYLQIAFSGAPIWLLLIPYPFNWIVIGSSAACAAAGILLTFSPIQMGRHAGTIIYIAMGATQAASLRVFGVWSHLLPLEQELLVGCLCAYAVGSQIYAHATPRLWPRVFGFHELWHLLVVVGSACSFACCCSVLARHSIRDP
jgi:hemolysin III